MATKDFNSSAPSAKGHETPTLDSLTKRRRTFVIRVAAHGDETQAALEAGYSEGNAAVWGFELGRDPDIIAALEEYTNRRLNATEFARYSVVDRCRAEATVTMTDLTYELPADPDDPDSKPKLRVRPLNEIDPQFRGCLGMLKVSREGHIEFNTTAQNNARKSLATYMKWDREEAHSAPPIHFDFSGLKDDAPVDRTAKRPTPDE